MVQRRGLPMSIYGVILIPIVVISYYISGIFSFPDVTIYNYSIYLEKVLAQFYKPWIWFNDKTPACIGVGLVAWIFLCYYISFHFRNFQTGKEYGDEDWGNPFDVSKRRADPVYEKNRVLTRNVRIAKQGDKAPSNNNMLVIGSSGTYKTTSIVTPNLLQAQDNYIVLDVKGELMYKYGLYLESKGYTVRCLNLKDQSKSDRYNPFDYIENENDLIKLISNIYDALTPPDSAINDPFWTDGPMMYLQSVFYYEWFIARLEGRKGTFNNVLKYVNEEMMPDTSVKVKKGEEPPSLLQTRMNRLAEMDSPMNPAVRDYRKFKSGAAETVKSIIIIINAKLKLCETGGLKRIFSDDDIHLREFATGVGGTVEEPTDNKLALFLCVDDNDNSFNFICSMLYSQTLEILCRMADVDFKDRGGALPIALEMWMDEFYAGARPHDTEKLMGTIRSRNISMIPILQSVAQIKVCFNTDKWEVIMDNCPTMLFLGSGAGALETHKFISELLGKMTIDTMTDGKHGKQMNANYNRSGRELMTPAEVKRMNRKYAIVFTEEERPIYDRKALPWEMPGKDNVYKQAMRLNKESDDGGYIHNVEVFVDEADGEHHTLKANEGRAVIKEVDPAKVPEDAKVITYGSEDEFLRANFECKKKETYTVQEMLDFYNQLIVSSKKKSHRA